MGLKGELQSGCWNLRENSGFKGGVAEWLLEFEREFGFQRGSCTVGFGILRERIRASVGSCRTFAVHFLWHRGSSSTARGGGGQYGRSKRNSRRGRDWKVAAVC